MAFAPPTPGRSVADAALAFQVIVAALATIGTVGFLLVVPQLGGLGLGDPGEGGGSSVGLHGLGFSLVDAAAATLIALSVLEWLFVVADVVWVRRPLGRGDLLEAEAPALLLGILQLLLGGVLPGVLLIVSSRQIRDTIRNDPALEAARNDLRHVPPARGHERARMLGRAAMAGLGAVWGVAGVAMFSNQFYLYLPSLIRASSQGTPPILSGWFHFWEFASSLGGLPASYAAGVVQLVLAFALLAGFARAFAYYFGILVAVFVWVVPEAFGGPFASGAFSIGPGVVYVLGLLLLISLDAQYGADRATLDAAIQRRFPGWARVAEVSVGPLPAIGRWHVRNGRALARASELLMGAALAASAAVALYFRLPDGLGRILAGRSASGPLGTWYAVWVAGGAPVASALAWALIAVEGALALLLVLGLARWLVGPVGAGMALVLWAVVEGFGGIPGPGYTDPGVGIAEFFVFLGLIGSVAVGAVSRNTLGVGAVRRPPPWQRAARPDSRAPPP